MGMLAELELDARRRWAIENLTESEGLTADLSDEDAKVLLTWGISQAEVLVDETADLPSDRAAEMLAKQLTLLRKLMRGMNKLASDTRPIEQTRLEKRLIRLQETARYLGFASETAAIQSAAQRFSQLPSNRRLAQLIQLFSASAVLPAPPEDTIQ